jgi:hypothetical protein
MKGESDEEYLIKSKEILSLINQFRQSPKTLAKHLRKLKTNLNKENNILSEPGKMPIQMVEGEEVIDETILFLENQKSVPPLKWDDSLSLSALEHVKDIGPKGLLSYEGSDGTDAIDRISKYGKYVQALGENIDFGPNDAIGVIVSLALDDGETERPHRMNIFKEEYKKVGIACGYHKTEYQVVVIDFAYDFIPKSGSRQVPMTPNYATNKEKLFKTPGGNPRDTNENTMKIIEQKAVQFKTNTQYKPETNKISQSFSNNNNNGDLAYTIPHSTKNVNNQALAFPNSNSNYQLDQRESLRPNFQKFDEKMTTNEIKKINTEKRIVSKFVEIQTKIIYTFDDGTTKEVIEKDCHVFKN